MKTFRMTRLATITTETANTSSSGIVLAMDMGIRFGTVAGAGGVAMQHAIGERVQPVQDQTLEIETGAGWWTVIAP